MQYARKISRAKQTFISKKQIFDSTESSKRTREFEAWLILIYLKSLSIELTHCPSDFLRRTENIKRSWEIVSSCVIISRSDFLLKGLLKIFCRYLIRRDRSICRGRENVGRKDYPALPLNSAASRLRTHERTTLFRIHALEPTPTIRLGLTHLRLCRYVCPKIYANIESIVSPFAVHP